MRLSPMRKSANEKLDFDIDFSNWLASGDSITDVSAVINGDASAPKAESVEIFNPIIKIWISGGVTFKNYDAKVIVTTHSGRIVEVVFNLRIVEF